MGNYLTKKKTIKLGSGQDCALLEPPMLAAAAAVVREVVVTKGKQ
jgi:hypothetical protein